MKDLSVAYEIKKKNSKKKSNESSAKAEKRPMPEDKHNDSKQIAKNEPEMKAIPKPKIVQIKNPSLMGNPKFSVKTREELDAEHQMQSMPPKKYEGMSSNKRPPEDDYMSDQVQMLAGGGEVEDPNLKENYNDMAQLEQMEEQHASLAAAIMAKRQKMAEGGMVDLTLNQKPQPGIADDLNKEALKHDMEKMPSQPLDSNKLGDELEDADEYSMISQIRAKMAKKRFFGE